VTVARQLATDAFIKAVLHDGTKIDTVAHHRSRYQPAWLKTALQLGDPPDFTGVACTNCANRYGIDWDHQHPYANGGPTSLDNLHPLCWACHQQKTRQDRAAGLLKPAPPTTPAPGPAPDNPTDDAEQPRPVGPSPSGTTAATRSTPAPTFHPNTTGPPAGDTDAATPPTTSAPTTPAATTLPDVDMAEPGPATPVPQPARKPRRSAA
ncbi:MAG TPA: HNH endonuclease signature motif containing protein, partial [Acidimicrobiales bacterium]|nr:HNH endonuclease signature motif containing protein [Acidimicrobiales bacterium]